MSTEVVTQIRMGIFQMPSPVIPCDIYFCTTLIPIRTCHCPMLRPISWSSAGLSGASTSSDCLPLLPTVVTPTSASFPHFVFLCWGWPCLHVIHQGWLKTGREMVLQVCCGRNKRTGFPEPLCLVCFFVFWLFLIALYGAHRTWICR